MEARQAAACPDNTGVAAFAVPLTISAGASTHLARLLVSSPGRQFQQMLSLKGAVEVHVDMREAQIVVPASAEQAAPTSKPSAAASVRSCPICSRRSCTELEDVGDRCLPILQLLAALPAPTCPLPFLAAKPNNQSECRQPIPPGLAVAAGPAHLLLPGLGAACAAQALALAIMLLRRGGPPSEALPAADGQDLLSSRDAAAASPPRPARHPSLRDACTSPLVLLASPFVNRRQQAVAAAAIGATAEEGGQGPLAAAAAEPATAQPQAHGGHKPVRSMEHNDGRASLPAPPNGWTRLVGY